MNKADLLKEFEEDIKQSCVIDLDTIKPEMDRTFIHGKPRGEITHFPAVDECRNFTWKKGGLYCITGNPASGKSEFTNTLTILKSINDGWKWMVYSPESYPVMDFVDTLIHTYIGKSTDSYYSNQMNKIEYDKGYEFVKKYFKPIDFQHVPTTEEIKEAFIASDCDGLVIDPYNSLDDKGEPLYNFLKKSLTEWKRIAVKEKRTIVLIEHPHSANSLDEKGNPNEPSEYTLSGGKMWHNKCDVIGVVHRPLVHSDPQETIVTFRTRKVKNQKLNGFPGVVEMNFDRAENRYFTRHSFDGKKITGFEQKQTKLIEDDTNFRNSNSDAFESATNAPF